MSTIKTSSGTAGLRFVKGRKRRLSYIAGKSERSRMYQKAARAQHLSHMKDAIVFSGTASYKDISKKLWQSQHKVL